MTDLRTLPTPSDFDPARQRMVGLFAAQLDDQLRLLKEDIAGFDVRALEWQPARGCNTTGMLLAHNAVVEVYWLRVAMEGLDIETEGNELLHKTIGIRMEDDGLPCPPDGGHPEALAGKSLEEYIWMLDAARASTHGVLQSWEDADLDTTYQSRNRTISRAWTVYHVLEHFCGHYGQILVLRHMMWDAGVLAKPEKV